MAQRRVSRPIFSRLLGLVASALMVAMVSGLVALLEPRVPSPYLLVVYVLVVMAVAIVWGTGMAAFTAILSAAAYSYVVHRAFWSLIEDPSNVVGLTVFLATAVVVGQLTARLHRAAQESERLSEEQSALRRIATLVARSTAPSEVFEAVIREVGLLCDADLARMERYEADGTVTGVAAWSRIRSLSRSGIRCALRLTGGSRPTPQCRDRLHGNRI